MQVVVDVEGVLFKTTRTTLTAVEGSRLAQLVHAESASSSGDKCYIYLDRDSSVFPVILGFLRDGKSIPLPSDGYILEKISHEARYYELNTLAHLADVKRKSVERATASTSRILEERRRPLAISRPTNFVHVGHLGWHGQEGRLVAAGEESAQLEAMKRIALLTPPPQVYNIVDGGDRKYGSHGVEVVLSSRHIHKQPIPPLRPIPFS